MKLFTFIIYIFYFFKYGHQFRQFFSSSSFTNIRKSTEAAGEPLILTPFLESGNIEQARSLSEVSLSLPNVYSNAGYFTVDEIHESNLFFWFFRKTSDDWEEAPLLLWLQTGSSLHALFEENGPLKINKTDLQKREYSWTNDYNVLYIDQPVGIGYSFTYLDGYVRTHEEAGLHLYDALTQFFILYPELKNNSFYLTGRLFAGKYIPALAYIIHRKNKYSDSPINLKGLFIGNSFSDVENVLGYSEFLYRIGLIDWKVKEDLQNLEERVRALVRCNKTSRAEDTWNELFEKVINITSIYNVYDYTGRDNRGKGNEFYEPFIQTDYIRNLIHVGQVKFNYNINDFLDAFYSEIMQAVKPWIEELLEYYPIVFYNGHLDILVPYSSSIAFLSTLKWKGALKFSAAKRQKWYVENHLAGYYKHGGNLTVALVRDAGHMISSSQPLYALDLLDKFVNNKF